MKSNAQFKQTEIGEIPEDWDLSSVGELVNVKGRIGWRGYTKDDLRESGPLVLGGTNIVDNKINLTKPTFISIEKYDESPEIQVNVEDIIVTKTGNSIGDVGIVLEDIGKATINPNVALFRVNKNKILPRFLYFHLLTTYSQNFLKNSSSSSAQPAINQATLRQLRVVLPRLPEQQQIASILSSLDDKIELNRRINKTLEEIGKALFKRWFVDFEFPNENGEPYKSSGGEMVESELGLIPKGWEIKSLNQLTEIKNGFAFKSEDYTTEGVFLLRTRNFSQTEYIEKDGSACLPESFYEVYKNYQLQKFDVLLVMVGASVGNLGFVTSHILPALQNQNMWNFRALNEDNQLFLKYIVEKIVQENIGSASGSARDFFRKDYFRTIKYVHPMDTTIKSFNTLITSIFETIDKNILEIERLCQVRDSLLPRLMSGKIRIKV